MLLCTTEGDAEREEQYLRPPAREAGRRRARRRARASVRPDRALRPRRASRSSASTATSTRTRSRSCRSTTGSAGGWPRSTCSRSGTRGSPTSTGARELPTSATTGSAGYRDALAAAGIAADPGLVADGPVHGGGRVTTPRGPLLAASPEVTAIFAANDLSALGVLNAVRGERPARARGRVGRRVRRPAPRRRSSSPPLTTVRQPAFEIAQRATEILIGLTQGGGGRARCGTCSSPRSSFAARLRAALDTSLV